MDARIDIWNNMVDIAPIEFSDKQKPYIMEAMQRYADFCINEQSKANGAEQSDSNCNIPLVSFNEALAVVGCPYRVQDSCSFKGYVCNDETCNIRARPATES